MFELLLNSRRKMSSWQWSFGPKSRCLDCKHCEVSYLTVSHISIQIWLFCDQAMNLLWLPISGCFANSPFLVVPWDFLFSSCNLNLCGYIIHWVMARVCTMFSSSSTVGSEPTADDRHCRKYALEAIDAAGIRRSKRSALWLLAVAIVQS